MTIEESIEVLQKNYPDSCYSMLREAVDIAIEALKEKENMISLDGEDIMFVTADEYKANEWIPCSERLPEEKGEYLVTVKNGYRQLGIWVGIENNWSEVVAWMPLPEPYNEEKNNE